MKSISVIVTFLFCFILVHGQDTKPASKLFIKGISGFLINRYQLNDSLELITDVKINGVISLTIYWEDSVINGVRTGTLMIGKDKFIPKYFLSDWKKIRVNGSIIFDNIKYFDERENKVIALDGVAYKMKN